MRSETVDFSDTGMREPMEWCYIFGKRFPRSEGVYQIGRNQMRITHPGFFRQFCCKRCARRGRKIFIVALVLMGAIILASIVYVIMA